MNSYLILEKLCFTLTVQWTSLQMCFQSEIKKASVTKVENTDSPLTSGKHSDSSSSLDLNCTAVFLGPLPPVCKGGIT